MYCTKQKKSSSLVVRHISVLVITETAPHLNKIENKKINLK